MKDLSRPIVYTLLTILVLGVIALVLASGHYAHDMGPSILVFDQDLSDSPLGWLIAIPVLILVGVLLAAVFAGLALIALTAIAFAVVVALLAVALAFAPVVVLLAIPFLAIYGLVKLFQRDSARIAAAA